MAGLSHKVERDGWRFTVAVTPDISPTALVDCALAAVRGGLGEPIRRSRHATTYGSGVIGTSDEAVEVFIKLYEAPTGMERVKQMVRGSRAVNVAQMTAALLDNGLRPPRLVLIGEHRYNGRSLAITARAGGEPLVNALVERGASDGHELKRAILRALGTEVAKLHRCGLVHGDLTPFNIFVQPGEPPAFVLIDHDRTRRRILGGNRARLRNLVQLGRFDLALISLTDKMRVFAAYASAMKLRNPRRVLRRLVRMLEMRRREIALQELLGR